MQLSRYLMSEQPKTTPSTPHNLIFLIRKIYNFWPPGKGGRESYSTFDGNGTFIHPSIHLSVYSFMNVTYTSSSLHIVHAIGAHTYIPTHARTHARTHLCITILARFFLHFLCLVSQLCPSPPLALKTSRNPSLRPHLTPSLSLSASLSLLLVSPPLFYSPHFRAGL